MLKTWALTQDGESRSRVRGTSAARSLERCEHSSSHNKSTISTIAKVEFLLQTKG